MLTRFSLYLEKNQIRRKRLFHLKKGSDTVEAQMCHFDWDVYFYTSVCTGSFLKDL